MTNFFRIKDYFSKFFITKNKRPNEIQKITPHSKTVPKIHKYTHNHTLVNSSRIVFSPYFPDLYFRFFGATSKTNHFLSCTSC